MSKKPTHVVIHKSLYMRVNGKLSEMPEGTEIIIGEKQAERMERLKMVRPIAAPSEAIDVTGDEFPKHIGGGNYELSDGQKVRGKEAAEIAQAEIDG